MKNKKKKRSGDKRCFYFPERKLWKKKARLPAILLPGRTRGSMGMGVRLNVQATEHESAEISHVIHVQTSHYKSVICPDHKGENCTIDAQLTEQITEQIDKGDKS